MAVKKKSPSTLKRIRQNATCRARNRYWKSTMRTAIKKVQKTAESKETQGQLKDVLRLAISAIAHVASKGVIHRRTASRKISRLTKFVNRTLAPSA